MHSSVALAVFLLIALVAAIDIIRRSIETMHVDKKTRNLKKAMRQLRVSNQPHITILIWGNESGVAVTEKSVRRSKYAQFDVSTRIRKNGESARRGYELTYRNSNRGEIIVCLRAGEVVDRLFLKRLVIIRNGRPRWCVESTQPVASDGVFGLAAMLQAALWGSGIFIEVYAKRSFLRTLRPAPRIVGRGVVVWSLVLLVCIAAVMNVGLIGLWYIWLLFSVYLLATVWIKGDAPIRSMLERSFAVPSALFFLPVTSFVAGVLQLSTRK